MQLKDFKQVSKQSLNRIASLAGRLERVRNDAIGYSPQGIGGEATCDEAPPENLEATMRGFFGGLDKLLNQTENDIEAMEQSLAFGDSSDQCETTAAVGASRLSAIHN